MLARIKIRKPSINTDLASEFLTTAKDRICLRVGIPQNKTFPSELESIAVEIVTAMYNRWEMNQEGIDTERVDVFSIKFISNLLDEYKEELDNYKNKLDDDELVSSGKDKLRFL